MTEGTPFDRWRESLLGWAIPDHILAAAPESPWIHPVESFTPRGDLHVDTPSRLRALEALTGDAPSVLDVGCGGGRAAFGLVPPAVSVTGVDHQQGMLEVFVSEAQRRGTRCTTVLGDWPAVADETPVCDVVVCHHVLYNVQDLQPFITALHEHALRRVVVEIPLRHPLSSMSAAWRHFWALERPESPTADDALACIRSVGVDAVLETFDEPAPPAGEPDDALVRHTRIRLCLTPDRDAEVREFLRAHPRQGRQLATIWWDVTSR
ncbi:MAG: hypothetical protein RJB57_458 [Actinomycetota bacterium]